MLVETGSFLSYRSFFLNHRYLSEFDAIEPDSAIAIQPLEDFTSKARLVEKFPASEKNEEVRVCLLCSLRIFAGLSFHYVPFFFFFCSLVFLEYPERPSYLVFLVLESEQPTPKKTAPVGTSSVLNV